MAGKMFHGTDEQEGWDMVAAGDLISVKDAAVKYGVHRDTIYKWISAGLIDVTYIGPFRIMRLSVAELENRIAVDKPEEVVIESDSSDGKGSVEDNHNTTEGESPEEESDATVVSKDDKDKAAADEGIKETPSARKAAARPVKRKNKKSPQQKAADTRRRNARKG